MLRSPSLRSPPQYSEKPGSSSGTHGSGRRRSGLRSRGTQLLALKFGWVVLVVWFEAGEFFSSLSSCRFPDSVLRDPLSRTSVQPAHVVLIADPHVSHPRFSYTPESNKFINALRQVFDELFMRKSWNVVMRLGKVDAVVMLGDMLDWGRGVMGEEEYGQYLATFHSIFQLPTSIPVHYVPGNHDVPLGPHKLFSPHSRDRYSRFFSEPNSVVSIANHSLVLLDAVGLVEEDYRRYASEMQFGDWDGVQGGVIEFIKEASQRAHTQPNILISHIPLARPERSTCGPLREHGRIRKGAGPGYQNLLGSETSKYILDAFKPIVVFSGDDHDYCEHLHPGRIREVTVKSFSSSTGIRRPGFQLLSLVPPPTSPGFAPQPTYADRPCFLPDQAGVYTTVYLPLVCLTVILIFASNLRQAWRKWSAGKDRDVNGWQSNEKGRASPSLGVDTSRRFSENRMPSRRSTSYLATLSPHSHSHGNGNGTTTATRSGMHLTTRGISPDGLSRSTPSSPYASPRLSFADEDEVDTPNISRRSSFIYMNAPAEDPQRTPRVMSEPSSYFSHRDQGNAGLGLGMATPTGLYPYPSVYAQPHHPSSPGFRRTSGAPSAYSTPPTPTSAAAFGPGSGSFAGGSGGGSGSGSGRRVTMPRLLTSILPTERDHEKKDRARPAFSRPDPSPNGGMGMIPVLSLTDKSDISNWTGRTAQGWIRLRAFTRWVWNMRNNVLIRSCWEVWGVAWVVAAAWIIVNGLFFLG